MRAAHLVCMVAIIGVRRKANSHLIRQWDIDGLGTRSNVAIAKQPIPDAQPP